MKTSELRWPTLVPAQGLLELGGPLVYHADFITFMLYLNCKCLFFFLQDGIQFSHSLIRKWNYELRDSVLAEGICNTG